MIVVSTGILSALVCLAFSIVGRKYFGVPMGLTASPPAFVAAIYYGIMANVCFTGGWIAELAAVRLWEDKAQHFGPICFTLGTLFSVVLTLVPWLVIISAQLLRLLFK
jgi:hypothetical protein